MSKIDPTQLERDSLVKTLGIRILEATPKKWWPRWK